MSFIISVQYVQVCNADYENIEGQIVDYGSISMTDFRTFIESPSIDLLENKCETKIVYSVSKEDETKVKEVVIKKDGEITSGSYKSGYLRLHYLFPVRTEFIEYISKKDNIEELLALNGIDCNVDYYVGFSQAVPFIPLTIWVITDEDYYFITVEPIADYPVPEYSYTVYSQAEYYERFRKKMGVCTVCNENIPVEFEYTRAYLPFRKILESMGSSVSWNQELQTAFFSTQNGKYALRLNKYPQLVQAAYAEKDIGIAMIGIAPYIENVDGTIMIDAEIMTQIADVCGAKITVDMENLTVRISKN